MTSINPRNVVIPPLSSTYNRNYEVTNENVNRNYQVRPELERPTYAYNNQYAHDSKNGQTKGGYKYTFYKDPAEYHYHSKDKDSLAFDSLKQAQQISLFKQNRQPSFTHSPSFRRTDQRSRQFLDQISNAMESHRSNRSKYSHQSQQIFHAGEVEPEQILFLKQKLIETHQKLLKQLEHSNKLAFQLETTQAELEDEQKQTKNLNHEIERMKRELDILHGQLDNKAEKNEQRLRTFQNKFHDESRRNGQLKDDLEAMRNKMLQTLMAKNNYEEENINYKNQLNKVDKTLQRMKNEIREKDQNVQYLSKQLDLLKKKYDKLQKECQQRAEQIHQYSHLASDRQKALISLQNEIKQQKQKNSNSVMEFVNLQAEHKGALKRLDQMEDLCEKYKGEIYWFEKNNQTNEKAHRQKLEKLTEEYNFLNIKYKQKEKQIDILKRKPVFETDKKKRNYEHTKQFVNRLETEQSQIGYSRALRAQSKGSGKGSNSKSPHHQTTVRNGNKSPAFKHGDNPITHEPITHRYPETSYLEQKSKYVSMLEQVGDLQADLLSYNMEKKRILNQMDKIDDTKMKTKELINRRRKLEDEANIQENKIKRVKQQLRKMKAL